MRLFRRLAYLFRQRTARSELADELQFHRENLEQEFEKRGLGPVEARATARRSMGNETYMSEEARAVWIRPWVAEAAQDAGFAWRSFRRAPTFAVMVVLTLGLGLGTAAAMFSLIEGVLLRPLPYRDADRLVMLFERDSLGRGMRLASYPTFQDWHRQAASFGGLAYARGTGVSLQVGQRTGRALAAYVSEDFFAILGAPVASGRALTADDFRTGRGDVAVLSYPVWQSLFGGDPQILGRTVSVAEAPVVIVGVMQPAFTAPDWGGPTDLWMPLSGIPAADRAALEQRDFHADSRVIGKLARDVTAAQEEMNGIARRIATAYPEARRWTGVSLLSLTEAVVGNAGQRLWMLAGTVGLVFLICCSNVANLYLAHGASRRREFGIRAALGAGRVRVLRQLLVEAAVLGVASGIVGGLISTWIVGVVRASDSVNLPRLSTLSVDWRVQAFVAGLVVMTSVLFGGLTAWKVASPATDAASAGLGDVVHSDVRRRRLPPLMLAAQVALTVTLLVGASLLLESYRRLTRVDPGFDPGPLVTARIEPPSPRYDDTEAARHLYERVLEAVAAVPGVLDAALVNHPPLGTGGLPSRAAIGGEPTGSDQDIDVLFETVSARYFRTTGIPIIAGRDFSESDLNGPTGPVIINETLARRWTGSPLGQRLDVLKAARTRSDFGTPLSGVVVGVVRDVRHFGVRADPPATIFVPFTHNVWASIRVVARIAGPPERAALAIDRAIQAVDPAIPLEGEGLGAGSMRHRFERGTAPQRFNASLVSAFAVLALILAAVGIYGVTAYTVAVESRETGLRIALGAAPSRVVWAVVRRALRLALAGAIVGIGAALGLTRLITGLLFEVSPTEPSAYLLTWLLVMAVTGLAAFVPARRAAAADPATILRA
jgi:predicted permease